MGCGAARGQFVGGFFFIAISLRHLQQIEVSATSLLSKMAISLETSSESGNANFLQEVTLCQKVAISLGTS